MYTNQMSGYQVFMDCFPGDNSLYITRLVSIDVSANVITFEGRYSLTSLDLPHEYRMTLWQNDVYISYNAISILTVSRSIPVEGEPEQITFTYEIVRPLAL